MPSHPFSSRIIKSLDAVESHFLTKDSPLAIQPSWIHLHMRPHQRTLLAAALALELKTNLPIINHNKKIKKSDSDEYDSQSDSDEYACIETDIMTEYGILADRVGSGKSLVALSLVKAPLCANSRVDVHMSGGAVFLRSIAFPDYNDFTQCLVDSAGNKRSSSDFLRQALEQSPTRKLYTHTAFFIVPHHLIHQWKTYVTTQTSLNCLFIQKTRDCIPTRENFFQELLMSDAVFVTTTMFKTLTQEIGFNGPRFSNIVWSRLFLDEADTIYGIASNAVSARFTWFISGSHLNFVFPLGISSSAMERLPEECIERLGSGTINGLTVRNHGIVADYLGVAFNPMEPKLTRLIIRNSDSWLNSSLSAPIITHREIMCEKLITTSVLKGFVSDSVIEALHAGDKHAAIEALGITGIANTKQSVISHVRQLFENRLQHAKGQLQFKQTFDYSTHHAREEGIATATRHVTDISRQIDNLEERIAAEMDSGSLCPICYDSPDSEASAITPCCNKIFCFTCICECFGGSKQKQSPCPICRTPINSIKDLIVLQSKNETENETENENENETETETENALPTKKDALLSLLINSDSTNRFLVFASHPGFFEFLKTKLKTYNIKCEKMVGTTATIKKRCRDFQNGLIRVLCLNAQSVGAGLNLDSATHVILFNKLNVELEKQVIGRAVRFERSAPLEVIHIVHEEETALSSLAESFQESSVIIYE